MKKEDQEIMVGGKYVSSLLMESCGVISVTSTRQSGNMSLSRDLDGHANRNFNNLIESLEIDSTLKAICLLGATHSTNIALLEDKGNRGKQTISQLSPEVTKIRKVQGIEVPEHYLPSRDSGIDAAITQSRDLLIGVLPADCAIVHIFDPITNTIAITHSGAIGSFSRVVPNTIFAMDEWLGTKAQDIIVYVSPCVASKSYKLGKSGLWNSVFKGKVDEKYADTFDQRDFIKKQLIGVGVRDKNISISRFCTLEEENSFFSSARVKTPEEKQREGRNLSLIGFK